MALEAISPPGPASGLEALADGALGLETLAGSALGLAVATGAGLLIGLERERRKGEGPTRAAAGIRSFTLAALAGGFAQALAMPGLVILGGALVAALAVVAYAASRRRGGAGSPAGSDDPGLTTELALFVTYLVGVLAVETPPLGAAAGAVVAGLLAARRPLHRFATRALSEAEVHDALLLAALALVALPLLPREGQAWLGGLAPRTLGGLVVLILALQAAGHVAGRLLGTRAGLALSGLFSGFVSSTATIASMGARARRAAPEATAERAACAAGGMLSTAATWVQAGVMLLALSPALAARLAPAVVAGTVVAAASGAWQARRGAGAWAPGGAAQDPLRGTEDRGPLRVREALVVAALLGGVTLAVSFAQRQFGGAGALAGAALAALADAHAAVAALGALHAKGEAAGGLATGTALAGVAVAIGTNAVTRSVVAFVSGGPRFGRAIALSLLASSAAAAVAVALVARA